MAEASVRVPQGRPASWQFIQLFHENFLVVSFCETICLYTDDFADALQKLQTQLWIKSHGPMVLYELLNALEMWIQLQSAWSDLQFSVGAENPSVWDNSRYSFTFLAQCITKQGIYCKAYEYTHTHTNLCIWGVSDKFTIDPIQALWWFLWCKITTYVFIIRWRQFVQN